MLLPVHIRTVLQRFKYATKGTVAIEFAIMATAFLVLMLTGLQFHSYNNSKVKLNKAVNSGMITAFNARDNIDSEHIKTVIQSLYGTNLQSLSVNCTAGANPDSGSNDTTSSTGGQISQPCVNINRPCACVTGYSNSTPIFTATPCGQVCSSGTKAGYYLTIDSTASVPSIFKTEFILPSEVSTNVTVRLD